MNPTRKQVPRLARPATRYWKGKAPKGVAEVESDSDEASDSENQQLEAGDVLVQDIQVGGEDEEDDLQIRAQESKPAKSINVALKDVNVSKDGKVIVAGRVESGRTIVETEDQSSESEEESEEEEVKAKPESESEESSEYESDSEEETSKPQFRPVFIAKRNRATIAEMEAISQDTEEATKKRELEVEERRKQSHDLVAESIRRELAEKEKEEEAPDIDDTDGLDPTAEFEAWRLREMNRIKRDKEVEILREQEREEIERRRALPEEQRLKEDMERAQKLREEKPKGQQKFLQKYWHKGAFHQDEQVLQKHDFTEATESTVDVSFLPKVMQVKNFGKRGRTKYTHLVDQDTTQGSGGFGGAGPVKSGGKSLEAGGCFLCGGSHLKKDCPQRIGALTSSDTGWSGRPSDRDRGSRDDRNGRYGPSTGASGHERRRDDYRDRQDHNYRRSRSRSPGRHSRNDYGRPRSRSPPRRYDYDRRDKRTRERSIEQDAREKRRRYD